MKQISLIKSINKIIFVTPTKAAFIFKNELINNNSFKCFSIILDKVNMHQAFDLDQDLLDLTKLKGFPKPKDV